MNQEKTPDAGLTERGDDINQAARHDAGWGARVSDCSGVDAGAVSAMTEPVTIGNATLYHGDCMEILPTFETWGHV